MVLIPKGGGGYRGIGLLKPIWKVVEVIMDKWLNNLEFHDSIYGFWAGRGLAQLSLKPRVFINLHKAFDSMDQGHCLEVLAGYGAGPQGCSA